MNGCKNQRGVGLIEVLIAVLVLAVSLLAIASLQTRSLQFNQSAYWRSQANIFAQEMFELLRASGTGVTADYGAVPNVTGGDEWTTAIAAAIPGGQGSVACDSRNLVTGAEPVTVCTVSIRWTEDSMFANVDSSEATTTLAYTSGI